MRQNDTRALLVAVEYCIDQVANAHHRHVAPSGCPMHAHRHAAAGIKYAEGQLVALSKVRRALRHMPAAHTREYEALLRVELCKWAGMLADNRRFEPVSPDWVDYVRGGLDAIAVLLAAVAEQQTAGYLTQRQHIAKALR
jgi:hypothetical protein